jgi:TolA-binding protein
VNLPLKNILSGLFFCSKCGKAIALHPYKRAKDRYECRNRNGCGSKSVAVDDVITALVYALENEELPKLEVMLENNEGASLAIQQKQLEKLRAELAELNEQEENQYDLLERKKYTEEVFERRNKALHVKIDKVKTRIYEVSKNMPKEIDYGQKIVKLKEAISGIRCDHLSPKAKNVLLKSIIKRIDYEFLEHEGKGKTKYRLHVQLLL